MSQTWTDDVFATGHAYNTDLGNMESNFAALKSLFSGASQPASMAACHPWFDTAKHVLKIRNDGGSAWNGLMHGDVSQKIWVYRNAAMSGWAIDAGVSDKVMALKGGSIYVTGGATAGSWTISGLTNAADATHTHTGPSHSHTGTADASASGLLLVAGSTDYDLGPSHTHSLTIAVSGTGNTGSGTSHNHTISHDGSTRPAAAVGTLQYLDL
jgi:hypothetical protein